MNNYEFRDAVYLSDVVRFLAILSSEGGTLLGISKWQGAIACGFVINYRHSREISIEVFC